MIIMITGGCGYLGKHLTKKLLDDGRFNIHVLDLFQPKDKIENVVYHAISDVSEIETLFENNHFDIVIHLATSFSVDTTISDVLSSINTNITLGTCILNMMQRHGTKYFINTGTYWQHFNNQAYFPVDFYAATKQAFSDILMHYVLNGKVNAITLKLYDIYGPYDNRKKVLNYLIENINNNEIQLSEGEQFVNMTHISDVVNGYLIAIEYLIAQNRDSFYVEYSLRHEKFLKIKDLAYIVKKEANSDVKLEFGKVPYRKREFFKACDHLPILPDWHPYISIETGVEMMLLNRC